MGSKGLPLGVIYIHQQAEFQRAQVFRARHAATVAVAGLGLQLGGVRVRTGLEAGWGRGGQE